MCKNFICLFRQQNISVVRNDDLIKLVFSPNIYNKNKWLKKTVFVVKLTEFLTSIFHGNISPSRPVHLRNVC